MQWKEEARAARQGLWLSYNPKKPWVWKRGHPLNAGKQDIIEKMPWKAQPILDAQVKIVSSSNLVPKLKYQKETLDLMSLYECWQFLDG